MSKLYNVSSSPHVRSKLTTGIVMYDVILLSSACNRHGYLAF